MADEVPQGAPPPPPPPQRPPELGDEEPLSTPSLAAGPMTMAELETTAETGEPEDRFRTWVAIAIAVVSILGAVVAFSATLTEQDALKLDTQGVEDTSRQQQIVTDLQATVNQDRRYLVPYQEHIKAAQVLDQQATTLEATDPASASLLHAQAESERVLARSWQSFFQAAFPSVGDATAPLTYDAGAALQRLENNNADLQQLRPEALLDQADSTHSESVNLVGLVTLFVAALLFLTLAQFTRPGVRRIFAGAGGLVAMAATILWILVLRAGA